MKSILFLCLTLTLATTLMSQTVEKVEKKDCERKCTFNEYNPLIVSHALLKSAVEKFEPDYPAAAKLVGVGGTVEVVIIVDKKGQVLETCVSKGPVLLRAAAQSAAAKWKFESNFGFENEPSRDYIRAVLYFKFNLKE